MIIYILILMYTLGLFPATVVCAYLQTRDRSIEDYTPVIVTFWPLFALIGAFIALHRISYNKFDQLARNKANRERELAEQMKEVDRLLSGGCEPPKVEPWRDYKVDAILEHGYNFVRDEIGH